MTGISKKDPRYSKIQSNWYLVAVEMHYIKTKEYEVDGVPKQEVTLHAQKFNVMLTTKSRKITGADMGVIRNTALIRMEEGYKVPPPAIADFIISNIMYLGLMSEEEYFAEDAQVKTPKDRTGGTDGNKTATEQH
jgi:hypothetical protein